MDFILQNRAWIFSGIGVTGLIWLGTIIVRLFRKHEVMEPEFTKLSVVASPSLNNNNSLTVNNFLGEGKVGKSLTGPEVQNEEELERAKRNIHILFIDDDSKFKVVTILKKAGWINTKAVKDVDSLDKQEVREADIFFVDIQGVGKALECKDEGLGLALNLKKKYPNRKVIIYSSESRGERFHEALKKADFSLSKNADPYEFQQLVEQYSLEILKTKSTC